MPTVQFSIRLDGKPEGCVKVFMRDEQSLKEARGTLPLHFAASPRRVAPELQPGFYSCAGKIAAQAAEQLGQEVLLRHFLVTVRGRTGYLEPQWEDCSITGILTVACCFVSCGCEWYRLN